jgi:hypothetical protein
MEVLIEKALKGEAKKASPDGYFCPRLNIYPVNMVLMPGAALALSTIYAYFCRKDSS